MVVLHKTSSGTLMMSAWFVVPQTALHKTSTSSARCSGQDLPVPGWYASSNDALLMTFELQESTCKSTGLADTALAGTTTTRVVWAHVGTNPVLSGVSFVHSGGKEADFPCFNLQARFY